MKRDPRIAPRFARFLFKLGTKKDDSAVAVDEYVSEIRYELSGYKQSIADAIRRLFTAREEIAEENDCDDWYNAFIDYLMTVAMLRRVDDQGDEQ